MQPQSDLAVIALVISVAACGTLGPVGAPTPRAHPHGAILQRAEFKAAGKVAPEVYIHVEAVRDRSKALRGDAADRLTNVVKQTVDRTGYATSWPGSLPTSAELSAHGSRAFILSSTVGSVAITKLGNHAEIACSVAIRIAPWNGTDEGERWEADQAATSTGSGNATSGTGDDQIQTGVQSCAETVVEAVTSRQVVPFLRRVIATR
jgi:hypothetical protein